MLEARRLDITPTKIDRLKSVGDGFGYVCGVDHVGPVSTWRRLVKRYFDGDLKPPFHIAAQNAARFFATFFRTLATKDDLMSLSKQGQTPSVDFQPARQGWPQ